MVDTRLRHAEVVARPARTGSQSQELDVMAVDSKESMKQQINQDLRSEEALFAPDPKALQKLRYAAYKCDPSWRELDDRFDILEDRIAKRAGALTKWIADSSRHVPSSDSKKEPSKRRRPRNAIDRYRPDLEALARVLKTTSSRGAQVAINSLIRTILESLGWEKGRGDLRPVGRSLFRRLFTGKATSIDTSTILWLSLFVRRRGGAKALEVLRAAIFGPPDELELIPFNSQDTVRDRALIVLKILSGQARGPTDVAFPRVRTGRRRKHAAKKSGRRPKTDKLEKQILRQSADRIAVRETLTHGSSQGAQALYGKKVGRPTVSHIKRGGAGGEKWVADMQVERAMADKRKARATVRNA